MRNLRAACFILVIAIVCTSIQVPLARAQATTSVIDIISARKELTTLTAAMKEVGFDTFMENHFPYTIFAPTNDAFAAFAKANNVMAEQLLANKPVLLSLLTYHAAPGWLGTGALGNLIKSDKTLKLATLHGAEALTISTKDGVGMINDAALLTIDLDASVGTVHIIDKVLVPAAPVESLKPNGAKVGLLDVAKTQPDLTSFAAVATAFASDINMALNTATVFAPSDDAFTTSLKSMNLTEDQLLADRKALGRIFRYHLISWYYPAATLLKMDGVYIGTSVTDTLIKITVQDDTVTLNGSASVTTPDLQIAGQVAVHVIDGVLIPAGPSGVPASATLAATEVN